MNRETIMIDDEDKTQELLEKLRAELPIQAYPKKEFTKMMKKSGDLGNEKRELEIESVMYGGDEGGILCAIKPWESSSPSICGFPHPFENSQGASIRERYSSVSRTQSIKNTIAGRKSNKRSQEKKKERVWQTIEQELQPSQPQIAIADATTSKPPAFYLWQYSQQLPNPYGWDSY